LPIIQTVFETLRDIKEGKTSRNLESTSASGSGDNLVLCVKSDFIEF